MAAAAWPLEWHSDWESYAAKLGAWVESGGGDLLVFPEYAGMEAALVGRPGCESPQDWLEHGASVAERALDLHRGLARRHGVRILMGSVPVATATGIVNRAWLIGPDGEAEWQDKQIPTPWERRETSLVAGEPLRVFRTELGRIGVLICHDAEFPLLARAQSCDLLLVPACTDGAHGAARIRIAARARALEGGCVSVLSQTLGDVSGCAYLDVNRGRAGIYGPPDLGFPEDGILADSASESPGWIRATLDLAALERLRDGAGEVHVPSDWPASERHVARAAGDAR